MSISDHEARYYQLLDLLGAKDHEDAARIIGEHHARELREQEVGGAVKDVKRAILSKDMYAVLMDVQNHIDSPALPSMANRAIIQVDKARAALESFVAPHAAVPDDTSASVAAIQFAITAEDGLAWLRFWNEGEFDTCRKEWPEAPAACYIGADPMLAAAPEVMK